MPAVCSSALCIIGGLVLCSCVTSVRHRCLLLHDSSLKNLVVVGDGGSVYDAVVLLHLCF